MKERVHIRRLKRFSQNVEYGKDKHGNYHPDVCWTWRGDYAYSDNTGQWYPVLEWKGIKIRADLLSYRMFYRGRDPVLRYTDEPKVRNVRRKCGQLTCVNPKHIEEVRPNGQQKEAKAH